MTALSLACTVLGGTLAAIVLRSHRALARALESPAPVAPPRPSWASLTIVRPIKGLDVGAVWNLEALYTADYPGELEILLVLDDARDAAFPLAREMVALHRERGIRTELFLAGAPPPGRTGKLHAMMVGLSHARGDFVAFNDSDTRPPRDLWRHLVDALLQHPGAGSAFAPVVAVSDRQMSAGDVGYALLLNGWYGPAALMAEKGTGALPFIMGQAMVFTRDALEAIGGLACADGHLVDDLWLGRCVARAGLLNLQIRTPLPVIVGGMRLFEFAATFRRWLLFSEGGLPAAFLRPQWWRGATYAAALATAAVSLLGGTALGTMAPLFALAAFVWSEVELHRLRGGGPVPLRHLWVAAVLPLTGMVVSLSTLFARHVDWRGRRYSLGRDAVLAGPRHRPLRA